MADHVHLLVSIPASVAVSKALRLIKGGSSHWLKETFPNMTKFGWQDGYAAFTVSQSQIDDVRVYIRCQSEHHQTKTFAEEYRAFLARRRIEYDGRYLTGLTSSVATRRGVLHREPALKGGPNLGLPLARSDEQRAAQFFTSLTSRGDFAARLPGRASWS